MNRADALQSEYSKLNKKIDMLVSQLQNQANQHSNNTFINVKSNKQQKPEKVQQLDVQPLIMNNSNSLIKNDVNIDVNDDENRQVQNKNKQIHQGNQNLQQTENLPSLQQNQFKQIQDIQQASIKQIQNENHTKKFLEEVQLSQKSIQISDSQSLVNDEKDNFNNKQIFSQSPNPLSSLMSFPSSIPDRLSLNYSKSPFESSNKLKKLNEKINNASLRIQRLNFDKFLTNEKQQTQLVRQPKFEWCRSKSSKKQRSTSPIFLKTNQKYSAIQIQNNISSVYQFDLEKSIYKARLPKTTVLINEIRTYLENIKKQNMVNYQILDKNKNYKKINNFNQKNSKSKPKSKNNSLSPPQIRKNNIQIHKSPKISPDPKAPKRKLFQ